MKKLFVFFALCAGMNFMACSGGKNAILHADAYKYKLLDDGTVSMDIDLHKAPKSFTIPAEVEGFKVSKVVIDYDSHYYNTSTDTITVSEGIQEFKCLIATGICKKLVLADSIKLMQVEVVGLESINIPKGVTEFDGRNKVRPRCNESYLELRSPQMKELVIPSHVTTVHSRGIQFRVGSVGVNCVTVEPKTEKITFENPNVKFTSAYSGSECIYISSSSDFSLKLQQCVQEINKKAVVEKK